MKIGIACPYSWDVPGGVQFHIRDLAEELIARGHTVSVIAPSEQEEELEDYVVPVGAAVPIRYNGSVARLSFGPRVNRAVRQWLRDGDFDVLHVHEPLVPSVAMLALMSADCAVVSTHHTSMERSRALDMFTPILRPLLEKIQARIAVSQEARRTIVDHLGGDAFIIPNGVYTSDFDVPADPRFTGTQDAPTVGFLGRLDEPRKGLPVLAAAAPLIEAEIPGVRFIVAGAGDLDAASKAFGTCSERVTFLGRVSDAEKAAMLASVDTYIAPNTGGESFGIILVEAMAAGAYVIASDIPAFQAVLGGGKFGALFSNENPHALAQTVISALRDPQHREEIAQAGKLESQRYDWQTVASQVLAVYETAIRTVRTEVSS
ncbi:phosphatidylinositol alpha-mannosyltransferase [Actinobaculum suis]|uniref:Glycosyltransferase family 4 protein n=1 Tax=Actinobaculum suis TaxID=1657 RepID=A0A1G7BKC5_9ACTO|nr:glycosyltransferase family 4 protein [Actinobaculum suis]MDY5153747.1 glycosyltransferase family 4 protein [Actinobaculum suis]SDE27352.1 phosphatidylinositol alpha-mannosyltransferase [Actinobaculum suis]